MGLFESFFQAEPDPEAPVRTREQQQEIAQRCQGLSLYHYDSCPFCVRVRNEIRRLGLPIEERNIHREPTFAEQLYAEGGLYQVPCLRIESSNEQVNWMYESNDIIAWLRQQFSD